MHKDKKITRVEVENPGDSLTRILNRLIAYKCWQLHIVDTLPSASEVGTEKFYKLFTRENNYSANAAITEPVNICQHSLIEYYFLLDEVLSAKVNNQKKDYYSELKMHQVSNLLTIKSNHKN